MRTALLLLILAAATPGVGFTLPCAGRQQEDPRLRKLVEDLVDDSIAVREKAAAELADLGKAAIPTLERLRLSGDIELRSRAGSILRAIAENQIVGRHWRRGPRITLDFENIPVAKVLEELARQGRDKFKFDAADLQDPMTVKVKDAPFFEALEKVCTAAPALTWDVEGDGLAFTKKRRPPYPSKHQGEFLVWLEGITFSREYDFTGNARSTFQLGVVTAWEAGIAPVAVEQKLTEILDEDGTNLLVQDRFNYMARLDTPKGRIRREPVYAPVAPGGKTVKVFSRVRGTTTYYFPRAYEELTMDVRSTPSPAAITLERITIAVRNFRTVKDACSCEVVLTTTTNSGDGLIDRLPFSDLAVLDDEGNLHRGKASSRNQSYSGTSYTIQENLNVPFPEARTAVAVKLRVLKDVLEKRVQFEFGDIRVE
jgi:hypothetical protein